MLNTSVTSILNADLSNPSHLDSEGIQSIGSEIGFSKRIERFVHDAVERNPAIVNMLLKLPGVSSTLELENLGHGNSREAMLVVPRLCISSIANITVPLLPSPVVSKDSVEIGKYKRPEHSSNEEKALKILKGVKGIPLLASLSLPDSELLVEYIDGETLEKFILGKTFTISDAAIITKRILSTVKDAYKRGVLLSSLGLDDLVIGKNDKGKQGIYFIDIGENYDVETTLSETAIEGFQYPVSFEYEHVLDEIKIIFLSIQLIKDEMKEKTFFNPKYLLPHIPVDNKPLYMKVLACKNFEELDSILDKILENSSGAEERI